MDVGELWSGVGNVAAAARDNGHSAAEFDLDRVPGYTNVPGPSSEDITTEAGFLKALGLVLRLRPAGLLWMGPLCSSFVFPDSSHCKRKASNFDGDTTYPPVFQGNLMAVIAAFLVQVALARGLQERYIQHTTPGILYWEFLAVWDTLKGHARKPAKAGDQETSLPSPPSIQVFRRRWNEVWSKYIKIRLEANRWQATSSLGKHPSLIYTWTGWLPRRILPWIQRVTSVHQRVPCGPMLGRWSPGPLAWLGQTFCCTVVELHEETIA